MVGVRVASLIRHATIVGPVVVLSTAAWLVLLRAPHVHHDAFARRWALWAVMCAAMMLPAASPWLSAVAAIRVASPARDRGLFLGAYSLVWVAFSALMAWLQSVLDAVVPHADTRPAWVLGAVVGMAGAYQLTPIKGACLRHCRSPLSYVLTHWRSDWRWAFDVGARHGVTCVGCCWALMSLQLVTGLTHGPLMAGLTAVVVAEQLSPWGEAIARYTGVALIVAGLTLALPL